MSISIPAQQKNTHAIAAARWKAVVYRDTTENSFVYAVRSTRIYCRPGCPARLARRANVEFFDDPATASTAGYRACKRCKPDDYFDIKGGGGGQGQGLDTQSAMIAKTCEAIASAVAAGRNPPVLRELASEAGLTPSHFHRVFKKVAGVTPGQYASNIKDAAAVAPTVTATTPAIVSRKNAGMEGEVVEIGCDFAGLATQFEVSDLTLDDLIDWNEFDRTMSENDTYVDMSLVE